MLKILKPLFLWIKKIVFDCLKIVLGVFFVCFPCLKEYQTFEGYSNLNPSFQKNSNGIMWHVAGGMRGSISFVRVLLRKLTR